MTQSKKKSTIIITIPAYNEERTLPRVLDEIHGVMKTTSYDYSILVVDDGSNDRTVDAIKNLNVAVVRKKHTGLAGTFQREMEECLQRKAEIIVHTDADGQYPAQYIPKLIAKVEQGYDLVLGSRFGKGRYRGSLAKLLGNKAFASTFSRLLKTKLTDTTTGFRAFTRDVAALPLINSFTYTQEQLIRAGKSGLRVGEIPIKTRRTPRPSRLFNGPLDYAMKAWINIMRIYRDYEPIKFFGRIGVLFFSAGFSIGLWLLYRFFTLGYVGRIPSQILSVLLMLVGIQIVLFGFLADMMKR
ncbi:TPA: glycosyltransferase family 2 protein [Candidatus Woesearchaeota archaeon]|nr:glycosyl transferase family 2 [archaeon]HIJ11397.1 glycosyltransferase family 2 protein [Candidatus Woesearchaeota archaeon]